MEFSDRHARIEEWAPLLTEGRDPAEAIAATRAVEGTDVDFGSLTRQLFADVTARGVDIRTGAEVASLSRGTDGWWSATLRDRATGAKSAVRARVVLVGAGGWTLKLLRSAGVRETRGYGLLPVSGTFLSTTDPAVTRAHPVKAYGKAPVGAPPMSMPHLDARVIDGERSVLFGPFAGAIPKYLTHGSVWDLAGSLRPDTVVPLATMGMRNLGLVSLLARDLLATHRSRMDGLRAFAPSARDDRWRLVTAGQRAQIVKPDARGRGVLQFGTEVITSAGGTIAGVLGASPGASTAVPIAVDLLQRCVPERAERWACDRWRPYVPALDLDLAADPAATARTKQGIARILDLPWTV
jgi:malate dehydrogenase (quinone)